MLGVMRADKTQGSTARFVELMTAMELGYLKNTCGFRKTRIHAMTRLHTYVRLEITIGSAS